jgi:lysine-N-methylase
MAVLPASSQLPAPQLLTARYMTRFRCLAGDCEATCCGGGAVPVERSTHRRLTLLAETDVEAQQLLANGIELTPEGPEFGQLRFTASGDCSMLDGAGLCRIQSKFGHAALFEVCATYPRYVNQIDSDVEDTAPSLELFGSLSCPEVARLALLSDDGFEQEAVPVGEAPRKLRNRFDTRKPYFQPYRMVRAALTKLLTEPGFGLEEKLFALLWLADQLRPVLFAGCTKAPSAELKTVLDALSGPGVLPSLGANFRSLRIDAELPLAVIWQALPPAEIRPGAQTERFDRILREVWVEYGRTQGSGASLSEADLRDLVAHYATVRAAVPGPARQRLDLLLSRYAVNHVLTTPYMLSSNLFVYAYELVVRIAMLRFLLCTRLSLFEGTAAELDARVVEVTYATVRGVDHAGILAQVQRQLEAGGMSGLPHALCFLAI